MSWCQLFAGSQNFNQLYYINFDLKWFPYVNQIRRVVAPGRNVL